MKKLLKLPKIAWEFGGSSIFGKIKLFIVFLWFSITRKLWLRDVSCKFTIFFEEKELVFNLWNNVDLATFIEVFLDQEYKWDGTKVSNNIVDAGANIGLTSLYFNHKYGGVNIYSLEPSSKTFSRLKFNCAKYSNIHCLQVGLSGADEKVKFYESVSSIGSSAVRVTRDTKEVVVQMYTLQTLFKQLGIKNIDLLKFDIEGSEVYVFNKMFDYSLSHYYIGEIHEDIIQIPAQKFAKRFPHTYFKLNSTGVTGRYILRSSSQEIFDFLAP